MILLTSNLRNLKKFVSYVDVKITMRKVPQSFDFRAGYRNRPLDIETGDLGIVLSGGGARAAYQVGALRALLPYLKDQKTQISVIVGSSIGAVNGLILGACLNAGIDVAVDELTNLWRERSFRNTFGGSPSRTFFKAIKVASSQLRAPGPSSAKDAIFDPTPLRNQLDAVISEYGGLLPENRASHLHSVAVMTAVEGPQRKPLLFLSSHENISSEMMDGASFEVCQINDLSAKHGFASAALPHILPAVDLDTDRGNIRLVDGGIANNVPVDPAARMGAKRIIAIDISGRDWWLSRYGEPLDKRPDWEIAAGEHTFCVRPPDTFMVRCQKPLGPLLKETVSRSTKKFISAVGPIWPLFTVLKNKLGEDVAFETMTYAALDPDYLAALMERGYQETKKLLEKRTILDFETPVIKNDSERIAS